MQLKYIFRPVYDRY